MKQAVILIQAGVLIMVIAIALRAAGYHEMAPPTDSHNTRRNAQGLVNTIFLLGIALTLIEIHSVVKKMVPPAEGKEKEDNKTCQKPEESE